MRINRTEKRKPDTSEGVSEIVGAILLISIVVLLIAVIGVFLFSQPTPQKIPNLNFMTGINSDKTKLFIYHNGGDTLNPGEFSVFLDGVPKSYSVAGGGSWSLGKNLEVNITPSTMPQSVQLVYNNTASSGGTGSTGAVLLDQASANIVRTGDVSPDQAPYLDCSAVRNWACADQIPPEIILNRYLANSTTKKINLMRSWQAVGTIVGGARNHFNFTVSKPNSTIHITTASNPNCDAGIFYPLTTGDKVGVTFKSAPTYFTVYGMAPQLWELTAGDAYTMYTTIDYANGTHAVFDGRAICHSYITEYSDLDSTLDITTTTNARVTSLVVNETHAIEGIDSTKITLINFQPISNGMFLITYGGVNTPLFVVGWADAIQYGSPGVNQTGLGL